jgi:hypothetical protein
MAKHSMVMTLLPTFKFAAPSTMSDGNIDGGGCPSDEAFTAVPFVIGNNITRGGLCPISPLFS